MKTRQGALLDLIYGAVADPDKWPEILTSVSDHLGAVGGMIAYLPGRGRPLSIIGRLSERLLEVNQRHYLWNPWSVAMKDIAHEKAVIVNSLIEPGTLARTGFYADVLAPQGIVDCIATSHASMGSNGGVGGFGFMLSARGADQGDDNVRRLQRLTPHLGRALDASLKLGYLADGTRQLAQVLQLMPNPALLLDGRGRITMANPAAENLLRAGDGVAFDRGGGLQLAAAFPEETAAMSHALAQALDVASGIGTELGEPLRLTRPSGRAPLLVLPVPLPPPAFVLWEMLDQARVLVLFVDPTAQSRAAAAAIQSTFGLTAAEARVAVLIGSGLNGPQVASMLGISPSTVKTHLKRCFDKTGLHSQVALARLLGALPIDAATSGTLN
jgi:DNA-binding CsgD family transcriptional regulator